MKRLKGFYLILLAALAAISVGILFGCAGKKEEGEKYLLTLDADGGSLPGQSEYELKAGEDVYATVSAVRPTRSGLMFGGWFNGDTEIKSSYPMPSSPLTLKARWKAEYAVEVYLQNISGNSYIFSEEYSYTDVAFLGETVSPSLSIEHFTRTDSPEGKEPIGSITVEQGGENTVRLFYTRREYTLSYSANLPRATGEIPAQTGVYEVSLEVSENSFSADGYRFAGWSTSPTGEAEYFEGDRIKLTGPVVLYAVWDRGFTDRFGSADLIFFPRLEPEKAYLLRGGHEFEGVREGENGFKFYQDGKLMLEGTVTGTKFAYRNSDLEGTYIYYNSNHDPAYGDYHDEGRYDEHITLEVKSFLQAVYTDKEGKRHEGGLEFDPERGDYLFTCEDGESLYVLFGSDEGKHDKIFLISGEEAGYYLGVLIVGDSVPYMTGEALILDGYGTAVLYLSLGGNFLGFEGTYYISNTMADGQISRLSVEIYDQLGLLGSTAGEYYANNVYTIPLEYEMDGIEYGGFIKANGLMNSYEGEGSLSLDGLGIFDDSAVYRDASGTEHKGSYTYTSDNITGVVVTLTEGTGKEYKFLIQDNGFSLYEGPEVSYREYQRITDAFSYPLLVVYDEEREGGQRADIYLSFDDGTTLLYGGTGTVTSEDVSGLEIFTFTRTEAQTGYEFIVPKTMKFYFTSAMSSEDNRPREVYCVLEEDGEKYYEEYTLEDGSKIWANSKVPLAGLGSLWFTEDRVIEGSCSKEHSQYFGYDSITFLYGDGMATYSDRYLLSESGKAVPVEAEELELQFYYFNAEENTARYVADLALDKALNGEELSDSGNAVYLPDYGEGKPQNGTYQVVGKTEFGVNIYTLTVGNQVVFRFVITLFTDNYGTQSYIYFREQQGVQGDYTSADGGVLTLDGFYWASLTTGGVSSEGGYSLNPDGREVFYTPNGGDAFYITIDSSKRGFTCLDSAYGEWILVDYNLNPINNATLYFDGCGNVVVSFPDQQKENTGTYRPYPGASNEWIVEANLGNKTPTFAGGTARGGWHVQFYRTLAYQLCIVYDEETSGTFVNDRWDVLYLDGFGGCILSASEGVSGTGTYFLADEEKGFMVLSIGESAENVTDLQVVFDFENKSFRILDYKGLDGLWVSEDFEYVAFGDSGAMRLGTTIGTYFYDESKLYAYLWVEDGTDDWHYVWEEMPLPSKGDTYTYNGKTYYRWEGDEIVLEGKITFKDKDQKVVKEMEAKLSFELRLGANYNIATKVSLKEEENGSFKDYSGFLLNFYTEGTHKPQIEYNGIRYPVQFRYTGKSSPDSFEIQAGYVSVEMDDYYCNYSDQEGAMRGGMIVKEFIGFGPVTLSEATYSGKFLYHNNGTRKDPATPVTFSDVKEDDLRIIGYRAGGLGNLYEIVFTSGEKQYAVDFYETNQTDEGTPKPCYVLSGYYEYEEIQTEGYTIGVKYLIAATTQNTPGFGFDIEYEKSETTDKSRSLYLKPLAATILPLSGDQAEKPVVSYDMGISIGGDIWIVGLKEINENGIPVPGEAYLISFELEEGKAVSAEVGVYTLRQSQIAGYLINFYVDDKGDVVTVIAVAYLSSGAYAWLENPHDLKYDEENDVWTFKGTPGINSMEKEYTLKFTKETSEDGTITYTVTVKD